MASLAARSAAFEAELSEYKRVRTPDVRPLGRNRGTGPSVLRYKDQYPLPEDRMKPSRSGTRAGTCTCAHDEDTGQRIGEIACAIHKRPTVRERKIGTGTVMVSREQTYKPAPPNPVHPDRQVIHESAEAIRKAHAVAHDEARIADAARRAELRAMLDA